MPRFVLPGRALKTRSLLANGEATRGMGRADVRAQFEMRLDRRRHRARVNKGRHASFGVIVRALAWVRPPQHQPYREEAIGTTYGSNVRQWQRLAC